MLAMASLLGLFLTLGQARAAEDVPGSSDIPGLDRYPLSYIVDYDRMQAPEYWLALGPMEKVNSLIRPKERRALSGHLTRVTYRLSEGHRVSEAMTHFRNQLEAQGFERLYQCSARTCGSSNYWANDLFETPILYGRSSYQKYAAYFHPQEGAAVALYGIRRGSQRLYLHLDRLVPGDTSDTEMLSPVAQQLMERRRLFVETGDPLEELAKDLKELGENRPEARLRLVGHSSQGSDTQERVRTSRLDAQRVRNMLSILGVPAAMLSVHGVGDLAPAYDPRVPENRVELVLE